MNILYVNTRFNGGGAEKVARQLFLGVKDYPEVNTFFLAGKLDNCNDIEYVYGNKVITILNHATNLITNNARQHDALFMRKMKKIIKEQQIDVIHFHNIHGNYMGIEDIASLADECKIVWTLHDMWAITGHCAYPCGCDKYYGQECYKCANLRLYPRMFRDKARQSYLVKKEAFVNKNITYVTPSAWLMEQCNKSFLAREKIKLIYNGVNINTFFPMDKLKAKKKVGIDSNKIAVLFAANVLNNSYKGFSVLLKALQNIKNVSDFELLILGRGKVLPINNGMICHYLGYVNNEGKLNEIYNSADIFVLPSIAENFPCTILESMAAGTPVIASKTGGIPEQIDENTGWLFDVGNADELTQIIERLPNEKELLKNKAKACRKKAEQLFSEEAMISAYMNLYQRLYT